MLSNFTLEGIKPTFRKSPLCPPLTFHFVIRQMYYKELVFMLVSGCGLVGRAVTSDTSGPRFESSHHQNL